MKAREELGTKKILEFAFFSFLQLIYCLLFLPPLKKISLELLGARIGQGTVIMNAKFFNLHHNGLKGFKTGRDCFIADDVLIDLYDNVTLEDQVTLAQRVTVLTHLNVGYKDHPLQKYFPKRSEPVVFKNGCVVGASSTILSGVTIGEKSFVAAASLVTENVPPNTLVGGVPAKIIRKIK
ncbi:MAG: acyltransferase [Candidatus Curtissbacteria bacterium]|nr:acyltransferase [Candidatus Curtissbacteria bacterium]